jgi:hypothetical protein
MKSALVLVGKVNGLENYQVIVGKKYRSACFNGNSKNANERNNIFNRISDDFVRFLINEPHGLLIYLGNGRRMCVEKAKIEPVSELEKDFAIQFHNLVLFKYKNLLRIIQQP